MDAEQRIPLIVVVGPTASGKTALGVHLAGRYQGEIVSADSMQIYQGMEIATAKPTKQEMQAAPHHLIGVLDPHVSFSVSDYVAMANQTIRSISARGKQPIVVGGTGLYVDALVRNIVFSDAPADPVYRQMLNHIAAQRGNTAVWAMLNQVDPAYAKTLHPNNLKRVIRGLESYHLTHQPMQYHLDQSRRTPSRFDACWIGIDYQNRAVLYERINRRVDIMLEQGLVEEARQVFAHGGRGTAAQAIGYKELQPYFDHQLNLEQAVNHLKQQTRRYAKRQLTWFRKNQEIHWFYPDQCDGMITFYEQIEQTIDNHFKR